MAKKHRKQAIPVLPENPHGGKFSALGIKTILWGAVLVAVGFWALTRTDPYGRNWASVLSPLLILGGYGIIAWGIFMPQVNDGGLSENPQAPKER